MLNYKYLPIRALWHCKLQDCEFSSVSGMEKDSEHAGNMAGVRKDIQPQKLYQRILEHNAVFEFIGFRRTVTSILNEHWL